MQLLLQEREADRLARLNGLGVLDEVTELAVAVLTQRGVQRNGFTAVLLDFDDLFGGHVEFLGQLLRERFPSQVLEHLALDTGKFVYDLDHVHRDTDGACLVGHRSGDGLADPPGGIGGELETLGVVELLHRTDQPQVALLDQVQEQHAAAGITLGQGHDQTQVGLEQVLLGAATVLGDPLQLVPEFESQSAAFLGEFLLGEQTRLDPLGELDLLFGVEQRHLADLLQVVLDRVRGGTCGDHLCGRRVVVIVVQDEGLVLVDRFGRRRGTHDFRLRRLTLCRIGWVLDQLQLGTGVFQTFVRGVSGGCQREVLLRRPLGCGLPCGGLLGRGLPGGALGRGLLGRGLLGGGLLGRCFLGRGLLGGLLLVTGGDHCRDGLRLFLGSSGARGFGRSAFTPPGSRLGRLGRGGARGRSLTTRCLALRGS